MQPYFYKAECTRVIDGDTFDVNLDVGFGFSTKQRIRLLGINCPERGVKGYVDATEFTAKKVLNKEIIINTTEKDSFGRWLANAYYIENDAQISLNEELLIGNLAVVYKR